MTLAGTRLLARRARAGSAARLVVPAIAAFVALSTVSRGGLFRGRHYVDVALYGHYVHELLAGHVPYRDFFVEYPPGAFVLLIPADVLGGGHYVFVFKLLAVLVGAAGLACVAAVLSGLGASRPRAGAAVWFLALSPLALGSVWPNSYDVLPAVLTAAAAAALVRDRPAVALAALGLAAAAKVYALALLPLAALYVSRRTGPRAAARAVAAFVATAAAVVLPFAVLAPHGVWESFRAQAARGLHVETLGSSVLLAADRLGLYRATVSAGSTLAKSKDLAGPLPHALAIATSVVAILAVAAVWTLFARGEPSAERLVTALAAAVLAVLAFGKILSPQYAEWPLFLVPLVRGRAGVRACVLLAAALALAELWFHRYASIYRVSPLVWLVLARNLLLLGAFGVLAAELRRRA